MKNNCARRVVTGVMVFMAGVATAQGPWSLQLFWGSQESGLNANGLPDVYMPNGQPVPHTSLWAAQIVLASNPSTVLYQAHHTGSGEGWGFWDFLWEDLGLDGVAFQAAIIPPTASGVPIMTRIFNHPDPAQATMFADAGVTTFTWDPYAPVPTLPQVYDFGTVPQSAWQVIPEPASAALIVLGAGGALMVRRWRWRLGRE
ncbi:MAG: PEP-CTERM sorting domain-containing protein [Kiritimatiellae bacterium]|nr:PEP-CTERM sorting domain-containing protein [Kiritimatiellia bacterium]